MAMPPIFAAKQPNGLYALYDSERSDVTETNLSRAEVEAKSDFTTNAADAERWNYDYLGMGDNDPPTLTRWEAILRMMQIRNPARAEHLATVGTAQAQSVTTDKPKPEVYRDEASVIVDDVISALSGGIGPRFDEMWESIGEWMRNEVAFCAACHSDPIAALVKDRDDARRELAETKARLAALEEELAELKISKDTW